MKKYLAFLLISFLIIGLFVLTGCDSNSAEDIKTGKNYEQGLNLSISSKEHNKNFRLHYDLLNDDFISDFSDDYPCYGKIGNDVLNYEIEFDMNFISKAEYENEKQENKNKYYDFNIKKINKYDSYSYKKDNKIVTNILLNSSKDSAYLNVNVTFNIKDTALANKGLDNTFALDDVQNKINNFVLDTLKYKEIILKDSKIDELDLP
jgi:hypothetical protein